MLVEADAFKEKDVIYRALSAQSRGDMSQVSQLVGAAVPVPACNGCRGVALSTVEYIELPV